MTKVLAFGASIVYGAWDKEGGWVTRIRKDLDKKSIDEPNKYYFTTYNLGVSGETAKDILGRIEFESSSRIREEGDTIILLSLGTNDTLVDNGTKKPKTNAVDFRNNIIKLIEKARSIASMIVFIGLSPIDESKMCPIPWMQNFSLLNKYVKEYDKITKDVCKEMGIRYLSVYDKFVEKDYRKLLEDGLHPNTKGHELIFEIVKEYLERNKII